MIRLPKRPTQIGEFFDWCRNIHDIVASLVQNPSPGSRRTITPRGTFVSADPRTVPGGGPGEVEQFAVMHVHRDILVCQRVTYDESPSVSTWIPDGVDVRIAKPEAIRMRGWDTTGLGIIGVDGYHYTYLAGGTNPDAAQNPFIERTATLIDGNEYGAAEVSFAEQVWPKYIENRTIIYAAKVKQSPIITVTETTDSVPTTYPVEWVDLNVDGRTFQPKFRKLRICVEGQTGPWFVLVRTANPFQEE